MVDDPSGRPSPLHDVGSLVERAVEALDGRPGRGRPSAVLGWSVGGIVAHHLAHELDRLGHDVSLVALVDTFFPGEDRHLWSNRWWTYKSMLRPGGFAAAGRQFGDLLGRRVRRRAATFGRWVLERAGEPVPPPPARTKAGVPFRALDHRPVRSPVPMALYAPDTTNPARTVHRWRTVAPELRVVPIEGRHRGFRSVMAPDRVRQITDDLVARLGDV